MAERRGFIYDIRTKFDDEMAKLAHSLADGGADDYPAYRQKVGHYRAMKHARRMVDDCIKTYLDDDESNLETLR